MKKALILMLLVFSASLSNSQDRTAPITKVDWKEMDGTIVALKQKLGHTGSKPEVAVNLERRVGIEEIGIDATVGIFFCQGIAWQQVQHVVDNRQGMVAVEHPCPEVDFPSEAPSCGHIPALQESDARNLVIHRASSRHGCALAHGTMLGTDGRRDDK